MNRTIYLKLCTLNYLDRKLVHFDRNKIHLSRNFLNKDNPKIKYLNKIHKRENILI